MAGAGVRFAPPVGGPAGHAPVSQPSGAAPHVPVLLAEVLEQLGAAGGGDFLDGTFGAGGYTRAILAANPKNRVLALDRDPTAIANGQALVAASGGRLSLVETEFARMEEAAADTGFAGFDGIVLDIGVSSMQLDQSLRGFSFRNDGPLDMRMAQGGVLEGESAADIVNTASEARLADIFYHYGEERLARVIARAIVHDRKAVPFTTTRQLSDMIGRIVRTRPGDIHPATRAFQALRIAVNDELNELAKALHAAERLLRPGGKLVVVSFHSLEDRIVKVFLAARSGRGGGSRHAPVMAAHRPTFKLDGKFPLMAGEAELALNPRARSAKLRAATRLETPAQGEDEAVFALAALPEPKPQRSGKSSARSAKPARGKPQRGSR